jgi:hypothetical protein
MTEIRQDQVDQAVSLLLRHARGAPTAHFGDTRERSSHIRRSVHRLDEPELRRQFQIMDILARSVPTGMIPREKRHDLYDVTHELRSEYWDRTKIRKDA